MIVWLRLLFVFWFVKVDSLVLMCEIVFDIEIIGFDFNQGDCIVEIGCIELVN